MASFPHEDSCKDHTISRDNHQEQKSPHRTVENRDDRQTTTRLRVNNGDDELGDLMSESEEHELDEVGSDDGDAVDEETALSGKERQRHLRKKGRRNQLDVRIGGDGGISLEEKRLANKTMYRTLIINGILIASWYFFSLSISIYNKWMFSADHLDFKFPLFTTSLHMLVQTLLAGLVLLLVPSLRPRNPPSTQPTKPLITPLFYLTRLVPCGTTTSLDIGLGNTSLIFISLTFYTMCKSSVLGFVLLFAFLFRLESPSWKLILIILTMTVGVTMMVAGETTFNGLGFALAISASFFSGFRWALTQILLLRHPATSNPFATLFFLAPIMFVTLFSIACLSETPTALIMGLHTLSKSKGSATATLLLLFPGMLAFCMTSSEFALLQRTNVVTLSICGIFKEVVTISAAGLVFGDPLTPVNVSGLLVTLASIAAYNYLKITKMRRQAIENAKKVVTSDEHLRQDDDDDSDPTEEAEEGVDYHANQSGLLLDGHDPDVPARGRRRSTSALAAGMD